ncbi:MAG: serine/threonine protein kinase [Candidatus Obscuribacterales bacterium]
MPEQTRKANPKIKTICPQCGKQRVARGSITGWLFSEKHCTCFTGGLPGLSPGRPDPIETGSTGTNLPHEALGANYQFLALLGRGGMGSVYKVRDLSLGTDFAVKILNEELAENAEALKRFYMECEAASSLSHPNLVSVYKHGQTKQGSPYLIMDYIEGESLAALLEQEVYLGPGRCLGILVAVAEALVYAHKEGILHRDLKPANIMLTTTTPLEMVKLVDFGIAKALESNIRMTQDLTKTGDVLGTPVYMSPEQCLGFQLDARSDIYSFGCLMCEMLSGSPPFAGENAMQIIAHHLNEAPVDAGERFNKMGIPPGLQDIVFTCLAKDPSDRYETVDDLLKDLIAVAEGRRPSVSTSRVSSSLRSPYTGLILEALPFSVPVLAFTIFSIVRESNAHRVMDHCLWSAAIGFLLVLFYTAKAYHLKASSSLVDRRGTYHRRKIRTMLTTGIASLIFCLSQPLVWMDFLAFDALHAFDKSKYALSWYFALLWVILALVPFLAARNSSR